MNNLTEELLKKAASGDIASFETIILESQNYVWSYALRFLGDYHVAEDAVQEIYIKIYKGLPKFDNRSTFKTWLFSVTRNTCVDSYRKNKTNELSFQKEPEGSTNDEYSDGYLAEKLNKLKPELRQAFGMVVIFGFSYKEAAAEIGCSMEALKSRLFTARKELMKMLNADKLKEVSV